MFDWNCPTVGWKIQVDTKGGNKTYGTDFLLNHLHAMTTSAMSKRMFGSLFGSSFSLLSTFMPKKSPCLVMCVKTWLLRGRVCKWVELYSVFLRFHGINEIDKHTAVNITPLRILSKMLKKLHGNTTNSIMVDRLF